MTLLSSATQTLSWTVRERTEELVIHLKHNKFVVPSLCFLPSTKKKEKLYMYKNPSCARINNEDIPENMQFQEM